MSEPTEDDLDALPEGELMTLPDGAIPPGWLSEFFARRAALIQQQDSNELALELSGDSSLHLMIFRDRDPKEKRRREEEEGRRRKLAEQELEEYREHSDRLLARIEQEEIAIEKRRKEIDDNALKLRDGRRVYVDGNQYRDENGNILSGSARDEAAELHRANPQASTWQQKKDIDDRYAEAERLRQKVLQDRQDAERGGDITAANDKLTSDEKEFAAQVEARAAHAPTDYGSSDYMAAYPSLFTGVITPGNSLLIEAIRFSFVVAVAAVTGHIEGRAVWSYYGLAGRRPVAKLLVGWTVSSSN